MRHLNGVGALRLPQLVFIIVAVLVIFMINRWGSFD
jgi:hypothetical protein